MRLLKDIITLIILLIVIAFLSVAIQRLATKSTNDNNSTNPVSSLQMKTDNHKGE